MKNVFQHRRNISRHVGTMYPIGSNFFCMMTYRILPAYPEIEIIIFAGFEGFIEVKLTEDHSSVHHGGMHTDIVALQKILVVRTVNTLWSCIVSLKYVTILIHLVMATRNENTIPVLL